MTSNGIEQLRELQQRLADDAAKVTTREDYYRLQMYWADVQRVLDAEAETE